MDERKQEITKNMQSVMKVLEEEGEADEQTCQVEELGEPKSNYMKSNKVKVQDQKAISEIL